MVTETQVLPRTESLEHDVRPSGAAFRLRLTWQAAVQMIVAPVAGAGLFSLWVTSVALVPLTVTASLLLPITAAVRRYAATRRRAAATVLGESVSAPYRPAHGDGLRSKVSGVLRDPQSWRDAAWLLVHSIIGCVTAAVTVALFLGGLFYLAYPLLFALTPHTVFGHPFGGLVVLHTTAQACLLMPLAIAAFGLWWALLVPLARFDARLDRSLLGH